MLRPGLIPARNHWCLHDDQLAQEFDGILNLTQTFPGCRKAPEGAIFYAPLSSSVAEVVAGLTANYNRPLEALYERTVGQWAIAPDGVPRFESGYLLMEPAETNKVQVWNANPDPGLSGYLIAGSDAGTAVLSRVNDAAVLAASGLSAVCTEGNVIELDNSAGSGFAYVYTDGFVGNNAAHSYSAFARNIAGTCSIRSNNSEHIVNVTSTDRYERFSAIGPNTNTNARVCLYVPAGSIGRCALIGLVQEETLSTPIITRGASASRSRDVLFYSDLNTILNQPEGMIVFDWYHRGDKTLYDPGAFRDQGLVNFDGSKTGVASHSNGATNIDQLASTDGTANRVFTLTDPIFNVNQRCCIYWQGATFGQGIQRDSGAWSWNTTAAYDGAWPGGLELHVGNSVNWWPFRMREIALWDEWKGQAWVEANLSL